MAGVAGTGIFRGRRVSELGTLPLRRHSLPKGPHEPTRPQETDAAGPAQDTQPASHQMFFPLSAPRDRQAWSGAVDRSYACSAGCLHLRPPVNSYPLRGP